MRRSNRPKPTRARDRNLGTRAKLALRAVAAPAESTRSTPSRNPLALVAAYLRPIIDGWHFVPIYLGRVPTEVWAFFVLCFGIALRLLFPEMLGEWDDFDYSTIAKTIEEGRYQIHNYSNWFGHRFPLLFPVAWSIKFFGTAEWVLMIWPFTCSVLSMVFVYFIARLLFNHKAAFFTLLLLAIHPIDVKHATLLLPASMYTFLLLGGIMFFLLGEHYRPKSPAAPFRFWLPSFNFGPMKKGQGLKSLATEKPRILTHSIWLLCWLVAGIFWAHTYYLRAYGLLIIAVPAIYMLLRYRIRWEYVWIVIATGGAWLTIELILYNITGEWMFIYKFLKSRVGPDLYKHGNISEHLDLYRKMMFNEKIYNSFTFVLVIFLPAYLWDYKKLTLGKRAALWVPLGFLALFYGYLELGVTSIEHMSFLRKLERYVGLVTPGVCLVIGRVLGNRLPKLALPLVVALLSALTIYWLVDVGPPPWITTGKVY